MCLNLQGIKNYVSYGNTTSYLYETIAAMKATVANLFSGFVLLSFFLNLGNQNKFSFLRWPTYTYTYTYNFC